MNGVPFVICNIWIPCTLALHKVRQTQIEDTESVRNNAQSIRSNHELGESFQPYCLHNDDLGYLPA